MNPKRKTDLLSDGHWKFADYRQRMTNKEWREILLDERDRVLFRGRIIQLRAKSLGSGVVEVFKDFPTKKEDLHD